MDTNEQHERVDHGILLGQCVRRRRLALGLTQEQVTERMGDDVPGNFVNQLENAERKRMIGQPRLGQLARALRTSEVELLECAGLLSEQSRGIAESSSPYDRDDDRAILIAKINDLSDEAIDALMVNAIWWEGRIKSRIVGEDADAVPVTSGLGFYGEQTDRLRQW